MMSPSSASLVRWRAAKRRPKVTSICSFISQSGSLLALVALERQLSNALGRRVDLLTEAALSPYLRERIKREVRIIYEA
jgi:predicted nucleotidyltransferase